MSISKVQLKDAMERYFGFHEFRPGQEDIVDAILAKKDVFAVMPTGGGKSLCYQLPACMLDGTCMVISPLIALMKDQVDAAVENGIRAAFVNSTQSERERAAVMTKLVNRELDLLYVSPERFAQDQFKASLQHYPFTFVAIDEAHCICEWGHDFRPDYLNLSEIVKLLPDIPVAAFTATATDGIQQDIIKRIGLRNPFLHRGSFNRSNLFYEVFDKVDDDEQIFEQIKRFPDESGVVYRTTRAAVEETASFLCANGIKALPYHAGLDDKVREKNQDAFSKDQVNVIVATIAFGMGIDKSNVRFVIHGDLPKTMENYYQESGRAGRDGEAAKCILLYSRGDIPKMTYFIEKIENEVVKKQAYRSLDKMASYASVQSCRRQAILAHFGEALPEDNCGSCDVCLSDREVIDITRDTQIILSAIARSGERFGMVHVVDIVTGADTKQIRAQGHEQLKTYGAGNDKSKKEWYEIVDALKMKGIVRQTEGQYPVLVLTDEAKEVLFKGKKVTVVKRSIVQPQRAAASQQALYDTTLFERLRSLRRAIASDANVPPFVIFADSTLHDMARKFPQNHNQLLGVTGVGSVKLERYGDRFIDVIVTYVQEFPESVDRFKGSTRSVSVKRPKSGGLSPTVLETFMFIKDGLTISEIAERRALAPSTITEHIVKLIHQDKIDSIDPYVGKSKFERIGKLFTDLETSALKPLVEATNGEVSYDEAQLVRAWISKKQEFA
jgi:ATP-dependent DNA helicase RecQ